MKTITCHNEMDHLSFFGLSQNPFPVAPDDENFYTSPHIDQVMTEIIHGIVSRKGFMVLDGDVGLGKTTLTRRILAILEELGIETSLVFHTAYQDVELLREINRDFGLQVDSMRFGDQMEALNKFLLAQNRLGKNCAIIIDDAQNLDQKSLELIRMISNFEGNQKKLVQILLVGQPELNDRLNQPKLKQLKSRIIIWKKARPLTVSEINHYLYFKFNMAGSNGRIFIKKNALKAIHKLTRGNLRQINILMDRCLYAAFLQQTLDISRQIVMTSAKDLSADTPTPRWKKNKLTVSAGLAACLIAALIALPQKPGGLTSAHKAIESVNEGEATAPVMSQLHEAPAPAPRPATGDHASLLPVSEFLGAYGLSEFEPAFSKALVTGGFNEVTDSIFIRTGYKLVCLDRVPEDIKNQYGILVSPASHGSKQFSLLFWKPSLFITDFYYAFQGKEITSLKKMLSRAQLFNGTMDGIVDMELITSVTRFQKLAVLPPTGYPDESTLFLLSHLKENEPNASKKEKISG